jgi:hypothetical protein
MVQCPPMRIFVLGTGASGALLAHLLARQGHRVICGDKNPERARRFLGRKSPLPIVPVNTRNLRGVVRAALGEVGVVLAAQDEVGTLPHHFRVRQMDVKIGGNEIDRLRRWYRQGKLQRSRGLVSTRFPHTLTPRQVTRLIHRGVLQNARFAAAVIVRGRRREQLLEIRWDASFPTGHAFRALFSSHAPWRLFPRGLAGRNAAGRPCRRSPSLPHHQAHVPAERRPPGR